MPTTALLFPSSSRPGPSSLPGDAHLGNRCPGDLTSFSHNTDSFNKVQNSFNTTHHHHHHGHSGSPTRLIDQYNAVYAQHLCRTCDEVWGPRVEGEARRSLLAVYGRMFAIEPDPKRGDDDDSSDARAAGDGQPEKSRTNIVSLAANHPRLAILGPPGGGKTTVLRHMAVFRAFCSDLEVRQGPAAVETELSILDKVEVEAWNQLNAFVPVWIELRTLTPPTASARASNPADPPWILGQHLKALAEAILARAVKDAGDPATAAKSAELQPVIAGIQDSLKTALREGRVLFLLDGLDEMTLTSNGERAALHQGIRQLATWIPAGAKEAPPNRIVITCRERTWFDQWGLQDWKGESGLKGKISTLDGFSPEDRRSFLRAWFGSGRAGEAEAVAKHLDQPPRDTLGRLARMASVPLNLTMIAWLVEQRARTARSGDGPPNGGSLLPPSRAAIYEQVVDAILWEIDDRKEFGPQGDRTLVKLIGLDPARRQAFVACLARLAFERLQREDAPEWIEADLQEPIARCLAQGRGEPEALDDARGDAAAVLRTLQCRAGILRREQDGQAHDRRYRFVHRSFLEYFVALHLVRPDGRLGDDFEARAMAFLRGRSRLKGTGLTRERTWEPLRLAAGYLGVPPAEQRSLVASRGQRDPNPVWRLIERLCPASGHRPYGVWLAGELAVEAGIPGEQAPRALRPALLQAMTSSQGLSEPERAAVGRALGEVGDGRPGVAPGRGKPFFVWSKVVPATTFIMGEDAQAVDGRFGEEMGTREIPCKIQQAYHISRYPVTNAQYGRFEASPFFATFADSRGWRRRIRPEGRFLGANQPVVGVDWHQAMGFCEWIQSLGLSPAELGLPAVRKGERWEVRLPSEAEWEYAARGPEGRWLPWLPRGEGEQQAPKAGPEEWRGRCNWLGSGVNSTSAVGMYPSGKSWCHAEDMIGNVWEWTRTAWKKIPDGTEDSKSVEVSGDVARVLRGGSWVSHDPGSLRCATRIGDPPGYSSRIIGFRVVCVRVLASVG